jgi:hypothetical protein
MDLAARELSAEIIRACLRRSDRGRGGRPDHLAVFADREACQQELLVDQRPGRVEPGLRGKATGAVT